MSKTTWMTSPDDGEDYAASTPADIARLKALGYTEGTGNGRQAGTPNAARPAQGLERPTPNT